MNDLNLLISNLKPFMLLAGKSIMDIYSIGTKPDFKKDGSPVTLADKRSEEILINGLNQIAPGIPIISEENSDSHNIVADEFFFLVDPLDGTKEFLDFDGKGNFTVNIGLIANGKPVMGLIYSPVSQILFFGSSKFGSYEEDYSGNIKPIITKPYQGENPIAVASKNHRSKSTNDWLAKKGISKIISASSSIKFCTIARGEANVYPRFSPTMEWDTAAGHAILLGAGGFVTLGDEKTDLFYGKNKYINDDFIAWGN